MLQARNLVSRYGETTAVDRVSLEIDAGEYVVIVGPNGSGKTTFVRHFNGLVTPDEGQMLVNGTPVDEDLVAARQAVGMVFQEPRDAFVAATIGADVAFGPRNLGLSQSAIDSRVESSLAAVNLSGRQDDRIDQLSGGEHERVAIAGALAMQPDHLVLDEPLTGLDEPARRAILSRLTALHETGTSVIVVTHDLRGVLDAAGRVVGMADGRIVFDTDAQTAREKLAALDVYVPPETPHSAAEQDSTSASTATSTRRTPMSGPHSQSTPEPE